MATRFRSRSALGVSFPQTLKASCSVLLTMFLSCQNAAGGGISIEWERPFGTQYSEEAFASAVDLFGNVVIAGSTHGNFTDSNAEDRGTVDAFVAKHDTHGQLLWGRTLGGLANDAAWGVATDEVGAVYIAGISQTGFGGPPAYGSFPFLAKYDASGDFQWVKPALADGVNGPFFGASVATGPAGSVFVAASSTIARFDQFGNNQWTRSLADPHDYDFIYDFASDSHANLYVAGMTLEGDAFLLKLDEFGNEVWHHQFGTDENDYLGSVVVDDLGHIYASGGTEGDLATPNAGGRDIFVSRWNSEGNMQWLHQFGTSGDDWASVSHAKDGGVFFSGIVRDTFGVVDPPNSAVAGQFSSDGDLLWNEEFSTKGRLFNILESDAGLATIYAAGTMSYPVVPSGSRNFSDIYFAKLSVVPEPGAFSLIVLLAACCLSAKRPPARSISVI